MSTSIDNRVVKMQFDNGQFEQNAQKSMGTMEKLKNLMNFESSAKGLDKLSTASNNLRLDGIANGVDSLTSRFSTLGIMGMTSLQNITNSAINLGKRLVTAIPKQIMSGGWTRATNIENAKFQLEGLGVAWEKIQEDLDYGVKDTAYGLDEAATVASQLVASQVEVGDAMKQSLRAVSGVAAMTNSSYGDIGRIFTTVAGQGRLMADQLNQIASRGVNAAAVLAKHLGVTEAEVREMTSKGKIDFATFAAAMDNAFGEHAKEANKTFSGAFSNMKAALNRIGADFAMPLRNNMRDIFNSITPVFNAVRKSLVPTVEWASDAMSKLSTIVIRFMGGAEQTITKTIKLVTDARNAMKESGETVDNYIYGIFEVLGRLNIIPANTVAWFDRATKAVINGIQILTKYFMENETSVENLKDTLKGLSSIFSIVSMGFSVFIERVARPLAIVLRTVLDVILAITGPIGRLATELERAFATFLRNKWWNDGFTDIFNPVADVCLAIDDLINRFTKFSKLKLTLPKLAGIKEYIHFDEISKAIRSFTDSVTDFFSKINFPSLEGIANGVVKVFNSIGEALGNLTKILTGNGIIGMLVSGGLGLGIFNFIKSLSNALNDPTGLKALSNSFWGKLRDTWANARIMMTNIQAMFQSTAKVIQANVKAGTLMKIAAAIGILALACLTMSSIDAPRLVAASTAVVALTKALMNSMKQFETISSGKSISKMEGIGIAMVILAVAVLTLSKAVKKLGQLKFDEIVKGLGSVMLILYGFDKLSESLAKNQNGIFRTAAALLVMAIGVRILAGAVKKFGSMDLGDLATGLIGVGASLIMFAGFSKMLGGSRILISTGIGIMAIATGMVILSAAVRKLGDMDFDVLVNGLVAVGTSLIMFAGFSKMAKPGSLAALGAGVIILAAGLGLLAGVINKFGGMGFDALIQGLGAVASVMVIFSLVGSTIGSTAKSLILVSLAFVTMGIALAILVPQIERMSNIPLDNLATGLLGLTAVFGLLGVAGKLLGASAGSMALVGVAFIAMGIALAILIPQIERLAAIPIEGLATGLLGLTAAFGLLGVAGTLLSGSAGGMILVGVAFIAMGAALAILVPQIERMAGIPLDGLATALLGLTAAFGLFGVAGAVLGGLAVPMVMAAIGIAAVSAAVMAMSMAFQMMLQLGDISGVLLTLTEALLAITALSVPLGALSPLLIATSVAMLAFAAAGLALGGALNVLVPAINRLSTLKDTSEGMENLAKAVLALSGLSLVLGTLSPILLAASAAMAAFGAALLVLIPALKQLSQLKNIKEGITNFADAIATLEDLSVVLGLLSPVFLAAAAAMAALAAGMSALGVAVPIVANAFSELSGIVPSSLDATIASIENFSSKFETASKKLVADGMVKGAKKSMSDFGKTITSSVKQTISALGNMKSSFTAIGRNYVAGLVNGVASGHGSLYTAGLALARQLIAGTKAGTNEHSPSKEAEAIGVFFDRGLINGVVKLKDKVGETAESVGTHMVKSLGSALSSAGTSLDDTYAPTITPVLDMTSVSAGYDRLSSLFSTSKASTLSANISGQMDANNVVLDYISKLDAANASRNDKVLSAFDKLSDDILTLGDRIDHLELRLDGDKLVGGIAKKADRVLGTRAILDKRGL